MSEVSARRPPESVLAFAARHLKTPAELDLLVSAHRSGRPCTTDDLASLTGLRRTHAQLCIDSLVASGLLTSSDGVLRVADDVSDDVGRLSTAFDRFRMRLVRAIMEAWTEG